MNKKLLFLSLLFPFFGFAQNAQLEINAKYQASLTQISTPAMSVNSVMDCDAVNVPWSQNFNTAAVPAISECETVENAGSGNMWETAANPGYGFTSTVLRYKWHVDNAANTWYFTPGLNLTAGQTYVLSYKYGSAGATLYTEKLKVHVGNSATSSAMSATPLIDHPLVNNNVTPITDNINFTPDTDGVYVFGFHCYSLADMFYLFVDDIMVTPSLATSENQGIKFTAYPNPVNDVLSISGNNIDSVSIVNMLGQTVMTKTVTGSPAAIDMQELQSGTYFAQVKSGDSVSSIKVIKK